MSPPLASVVIGVYNRSREIVPCLDSLLASTFSDFEIVLVEDGSTDGSAAVLDAYRVRHAARRIQIVQNPRNLGAAGARNVGIDAARGNWIFFIDSDCVVEPRWLESMVRATSEPGVVALSGIVRDKEPDNLAERAYAGSCLIVNKSPNLIECNMGLRADVARAYRFDAAIAYGGEGDDIAVRLFRSGGGRVAFVRDAVVYHHHAMDFRGYMRMAVRLARGHARYWYKHDFWIGRDVAPLVVLTVTLPASLLGPAFLLVPGACLAASVGAIMFNELHYKGKSIPETLCVLPVSFAYAAVRTASVLATYARMVAGGESDIRESKRRWNAARLDVR